MDLITLIATCAPMVTPTTMKAIVLEESRGHPYAIHDGKTREALFPATKDEAIATARRLLANGSRIDAGLAQINSANWSRLGLDAESVFDPCINLRAGERVILEAYTTAPYTVDAAVSRYNTGNDKRGLDNGYVGRVRDWMSKPQPDRDYEVDGQTPRQIHDEAPLTAQARREAHPEGEGTPESEALTRVRGRDAKREKVPAWSFVPVADGFGRGG